MPDSGSSWTISELGNEVASTERFAGGGAVAAMSLVGAASIVELVFALSARRRKLAEADRQQLEDAVSLCQSLRVVFERAIDEDIACLTELMDAQRQSRHSGQVEHADTDETALRLQQAIDSATEIPLRTARDAVRLLRTIDELQHLSRPFTASDLGAAAATISGAITSLLLMAEVNLGLIRGESHGDRIAQEIEDLYSQARDRSENVISSTRGVIRKAAGQDT